VCVCVCVCVWGVGGCRGRPIGVGLTAATETRISLRRHVEQPLIASVNHFSASVLSAPLFVFSLCRHCYKDRNVLFGPL
jgi:hypothetical protein